MNTISIKNIENLIQGAKTPNFEDIKIKAEENNLIVRQLNTDNCKNLYLLVSKYDLNENENVEENKENVEKNVEEKNIEKEVIEEKVEENTKEWADALLARAAASQEPIVFGSVEEKVEEKVNKELYLECNGIILEKNTNKIVAMCQPRIEDICEWGKSTLSTNAIEQIRLEYCEDGTVIRLYNYNDNWVTATTKCIDAKKSYWCSEKTFDELFWETFNSEENLQILDVLDKTKTYIFILLHKENRIIIKHFYNNLIYISSISNITGKEDFTNIFFSQNPKRSIRRPLLIKESFQENLEHFYNPSKKGIIIKISAGKGQYKSYQYEFEKYKQFKKIRGNVPSIITRYLELLNNPELLILLEDNYKEYNIAFSTLKFKLRSLYKEIHQLYISSHIKHDIKVEESHKYYHTLKQLHAIYYKYKNPITIDEVKKKINSLDSHVILKLIN